VSTTAEVLKVHCDTFIRTKRASGVAFNKQEQILRRFMTFCASYLGEEVILPKEAVLDWNQLRPGEKTNNQRMRVNTVRAFAEHLQSRSIPAYVGMSIRQATASYVPYIFTNNELAQLFRAADQCPRNNGSPLRWLVAPMILRTIYACGLRSSEATALRVRDVDLQYGVLTILNSKFDKDRLIPADMVLLEQLKNYAEQALLRAGGDTPFFPNHEGQMYSTASIYNIFRDCLWRAGISHGGKGRGPRLHDLRHTFAVHCLRKWVLAGTDLSVALPYLSAYMGHSGLRYSQLYLRLTAEMYPDIVAKMEQQFDVLPDWENLNETD
jgi:integrase